MQYHLNGFRPGDPRLSEAAPTRAAGAHRDDVDVLIVGCGPAGLTLAAQLARFPCISTRIIERKAGPMERGQADGISCRSMEMFNAFGFAETVIRQGYQVNETTFWNPDPGHPSHITRTGRVQDVEDGLSEMPHMILNQARVHDLFLEVMAQSPSRLRPDYGHDLIGLAIDPDDPSAAVDVTLKRREPTGEETLETVRARYVVGCDGARSAVRRAIGQELVGEAANQAWGVMDVLAVTDFPDIRLKTLIKSASDGNIIIIPREGGYLTRLYIELDKLAESERVLDRNITIEALISAAQRIFEPFQLEVKDVVWWSVYEIGQRLTKTFDDVAADRAPARLPRVFIAGDACHTHSPKAGQGMNVSMGDAFNLGWKLVSVLRQRARPELLRSYSVERHAVAKDLIDFDREWARIMSERPKGTDAAGEDPTFQRYFVEHGRYTAGMSVVYAPSVITGSAAWQSLAPGFQIGARFHSAPVVRLADAKPMELGHVIEADTRWRLFVFAPDEGGRAAGSPLAAFWQFLATDPASPLIRYHTPGDDPDHVFDLRAIYQQTAHDLAINSMPGLLLPRKGRLQLIDYEKVFCADHRAGRDIFDLRGINRGEGCLVIVRPDQHVAHILPLNAADELSRFFDGFLLEPSPVRDPHHRSEARSHT